jgi:hypothetical protein
MVTLFATRSRTSLSGSGSMPTALASVQASSHSPQALGNKAYDSRGRKPKESPYHRDNWCQPLMPRAAPRNHEKWLKIRYTDC